MVSALLFTVHGGIHAVHFHQLLVGAVFHDRTFVHDQDDVGILYGGQPMGDHQDRPTLPHLMDSVQYVFFGEGIQSAGSFVKNQDGRFIDQGPGN